MCNLKLDEIEWPARDLLPDRPNPKGFKRDPQPKPALDFRTILEGDILCGHLIMESQQCEESSKTGEEGEDILENAIFLISVDFPRVPRVNQRDWRRSHDRDF